MLKEFKEFAMRGNVIDLAVGVIIGAAFGKIVASLVDDIIMPPIGQYYTASIFPIGIFALKRRTLCRLWPKRNSSAIPTFNYGLFLNSH